MIDRVREPCGCPANGPSLDSCEPVAYEVTITSLDGLQAPCIRTTMTPDELREFDKQNPFLPENWKP